MNRYEILGQATSWKTFGVGVNLVLNNNTYFLNFTPLYWRLRFKPRAWFDYKKKNSGRSLEWSIGPIKVFGPTFPVFWPAESMRDIQFQVCKHGCLHLWIRKRGGGEYLAYYAVNNKSARVQFSAILDEIYHPSEWGEKGECGCDLEEIKEEASKENKDTVDDVNNTKSAADLVEKLIALRFGYTNTYEAASALLKQALDNAYVRGLSNAALK